MSRPNPDRTIPTHENFARRLSVERRQRGWSYAVLAKKMTEAGCKIDQSAIGKIERGIREVRIDELDAVSRIFGVDPGEFLRPPEALDVDEVRHSYDGWQEGEREYAEKQRLIVTLQREVPRIRRKTDDSFLRLARAVSANPSEARKVLEAHLADQPDTSGGAVPRHLDRLFADLLGAAQEDD